MRLAESKIKEALLHPEISARQMALEYFADTYRRDADLVPLVRQAVAQYGRADCFISHSHLGRLTPDAADVAWIAAELQRPESTAEEDNYDRALVDLLCRADPAWVRPLEADLLRAPRLGEDDQRLLKQYLEVASWDAERCWLELERMCGVPEGKTADENVDFDFASRIVEGLARTGKADPQRVLDLLAQPVEEFDFNPMYWMEIFAVMLAGELRLEAAVPLLVQKLKFEGDYLSEECRQALTTIGTAAVATLLTADFHQQSPEHRMDVAWMFEAVHDDVMVTRCLELLPQETDASVRTNIASGLVRNFAFEGIEPVRTLIASGDFDPSLRDLEAELCTAATIMGVTFPQFAQWKKSADKRRERYLANLREMMSDMQATHLPMQPYAPAEAEYDDEYEPAPMQMPAIATTPAGRNDPCPCGSGKKYKKCCLNRQAANR